MFVFNHIIDMIVNIVTGNSFFDLISKSYILSCMYLTVAWPFLAPSSSIGLAAAAFFVGGIIQVFLLRKKRPSFLFPTLCAAAEVVLEIVCRIILYTKSYDDSTMVFLLYGVLLMYVLLGALLCWVVYRMVTRKSGV